MTLVEVADGFLIDFLRHLEAPLDVFGIALVAKVALAAVVLEILEERLCEIGGMSLPCRLQGAVYLPIGADRRDVTLHAVARVYILKNLSLIDKSGILVVDDDLEAKVCFLPDEQINLLPWLVGRERLVEEICFNY